MATQKPLVIIAGQIQQLPSGATLSSASAEVDVIVLTAAATVVKGCPVYISAANNFNKANAAASGTAKVIGFAAEGITSAATGTIQTDGILACTTGEWDAVAGTTGGLAAGTEYYLDATAGLISATAPTGSGSYVVKIGTAISATELEITIGDSVLLA